jgi:hypothetical protein
MISQFQLLHANDTVVATVMADAGQTTRARGEVRRGRQLLAMPRHRIASQQQYLIQLSQWKPRNSNNMKVHVEVKFRIIVRKGKDVYTLRKMSKISVISER